MLERWTRGAGKVDTPDWGPALTARLPRLHSLGLGERSRTVSLHPQSPTCRGSCRSFFTVDRAQLELTRGPWVYDHDHFIILNSAIGGDFPGPPGVGTVLPQNMLIDYVRVYR